MKDIILKIVHNLNRCRAPIVYSHDSFHLSIPPFSPSSILNHPQDLRKLSPHHPHTHTEQIHAHRPFSARLSKQQTRADMGGNDASTSSELNQLVFLQWGHAVFAGPRGSEGNTLPPRTTACRLLHTLEHQLGFDPSLTGMNWICSGCVVTGTNWAAWLYTTPHPGLCQLDSYVIKIHYTHKLIVYLMMLNL